MAAGSSGGGLPIVAFEPGRYHEIPVIELLRAATRGWLGVDRRLVRSILDRGEAAMADVLAFTREPRHDQRIFIDALLVDLFHKHPNPEALGYLIELIRADPQDIDDSLVQAILPFGPLAVEPLVELYAELDEEQGSDIAFLLAGLRVRDERVLKLLLDRLEFDAADGAFCLGLYGDAAARPALEKMLAELPAESKPEEAKYDAELRREIAHAIEALDAPEPQYTPEDFDILAEYPKIALPELDLLSETQRTELLESPDARIRAEAAYSFFNVDMNPKVRAALLKMARTDSEPGPRGRAWASMADAAEDKAIRAEMVGVLNDPGRPVEERGGAAVGLYGYADEPGPQQGIEALYAEGGKARAKALEAMWRSLHKPFAKFFGQHLDDTEPAILHQALRGAGYFRLSSYADKIATYLEDEDFREDALFAYALALPGETSRGRARGMLRKIDSVAMLDLDEERLVKFAIDERLRLHGMAPVFENESEAEEQEAAPPPQKPQEAAPGRNDPCPCGSGKKYKKCHGK